MPISLPSSATVPILSLIRRYCRSKTLNETRIARLCKQEDPDLDGINPAFANKNFKQRITPRHQGACGRDVGSHGGHRSGERERDRESGDFVLLEQEKISHM